MITFQGDSNAPGGVVTLPDDAGSLGLGSVPDLVGTSPGIGGASKGKNNNRSELHDLQMAKSKKERTAVSQRELLTCARNRRVTTDEEITSPAPEMVVPWDMWVQIQPTTAPFLGTRRENNAHPPQALGVKDLRDI